MQFMPQLKKYQISGCTLEIDLEALEPTAIRAVESYVSRIASKRRDRSRRSRPPSCFILFFFLYILAASRHSTTVKDDSESSYED